MYSQCNCCGSKIIRYKVSKSGFYFCSKFCKGIFQEQSYMYSIPKSNPIFNAILLVHQNKVIRQSEYLIALNLYKVTEPYKYMQGDFLVTAFVREKGNPSLAAKTATDIQNIRQCFNQVSLSNLEELAILYEIERWKKIEVRYWDNNDITFTVE